MQAALVLYLESKKGSVKQEVQKFSLTFSHGLRFYELKHGLESACKSSDIHAVFLKKVSLTFKKSDDTKLS